MLGPRLDAQREDGDPFLGDDTLQIALFDGRLVGAFGGIVLPCDGDRTQGGRAVIAQRIVIGRRFSGLVSDIGIGVLGALVLEREADRLLVERLGGILRSPAQLVFGLEESHLRRVDPQVRRRTGNDHVRILGLRLRFARDVDADTDAHVIALVVGQEHLFETRVFVAGHVAENVGADAVGAPVVVDQRRAVLGGVHGRVVGIGRDDACGDGFGSLRPGDVGLHFAKAHRHAQLERIGIFEPLGDIAAVDPVVAAESLGRKRRIGGEGGDRLVPEHLHIDLLLLVVLHRNRLVGFEVRIGNRPVGVGDAVHDRHAQQFGESDGHLVVRTGDDAAPRRVSLGNHVGERPFAPVGRRIEGLELREPAVYRRSDIAAERTARQAFVELVHMLLHGNHESLQRLEFRADLVVQGIHLPVGHLVRIAIHVLEIARTRNAEQHYRKQQ